VGRCGGSGSGSDTGSDGENARHHRLSLMSSPGIAADGGGEFRSAPMRRRVALSSESMLSTGTSCGGVASYASWPRRSQCDSLRQTRRQCSPARARWPRTLRDGRSWPLLLRKPEMCDKAGAGRGRSLHPSAAYHRQDDGAVKMTVVRHAPAWNTICRALVLLGATIRGCRRPQSASPPRCAVRPGGAARSLPRSSLASVRTPRGRRDPVGRGREPAPPILPEGRAR
jgi:hypothetical protein